VRRQPTADTSQQRASSTAPCGLTGVSNFAEMFVEEVSPGVFRLGTGFDAYYLLEDGGRFTLVDGALPGTSLNRSDSLTTVTWSWMPLQLRSLPTTIPMIGDDRASSTQPRRSDQPAAQAPTKPPRAHRSTNTERAMPQWIAGYRVVSRELFMATYQLRIS
jgi:hypothetical protein